MAIRADGAEFKRCWKHPNSEDSYKPPRLSEVGSLPLTLCLYCLLAWMQNYPHTLITAGDMLVVLSAVLHAQKVENL